MLALTVVACAGCGDDVDMRLQFGWDDRRVLCSIDIDDLLEAEVDNAGLTTTEDLERETMNE